MFGTYGPSNNLLLDGAFEIKGTEAIDFDNGSAATTVTTGSVSVPAGTRSALLLFYTDDSGALPAASVKIGGSGGIAGTSLEHHNIAGSHLADFQAIKFASISSYAGTSKTLYFDWLSTVTSQYVCAVIIFIGTDDFSLLQSDIAETDYINPIISGSTDLDLSQAPVTTPAGTPGNLMFAFGAAFYSSDVAGETLTAQFSAINAWTPTYDTTTDWAYDPTALSHGFAFAYHDDLASGGTKTATLDCQGNPNGGNDQGSSFLYVIEIEEA